MIKKSIMQICQYNFYINNEIANPFNARGLFVGCDWYDNKVDVARNGYQNFRIVPKNGYEYEYVNNFFDNLVVYDRYSMYGRVAFDSILRVQLPSFELLLKNKQIVYISAFFFCS